MHTRGPAENGFGEQSTCRRKAVWLCLKIQEKRKRQCVVFEYTLQTRDTTYDGTFSYYFAFISSRFQSLK